MIDMLYLGANLKQVLIDLKAIVHTPIKPYLPPEGTAAAPPTAAGTTELADNDLPGLINKLTGRRKLSFYSLT